MSMKYKHKQTGDIFEKSDHVDCMKGFYYDTHNTFGSIHKRFIENSNDWELIQEFKAEDWIIDANDKVQKIKEVINETVIYYNDTNKYEWFANLIKRLATPEEILKHLIAEAEKRGLVEGAEHLPPVGRNKRIIKGDFKLAGDTEMWGYDLRNDGFAIYDDKNNLWATPTKTYTEADMDKWGQKCFYGARRLAETFIDTAHYFYSGYENYKKTK